MRLLQLNAWTMRLSNNIAEMIEIEAPDIVTLQEVISQDEPNGILTTLKELNERVRFHHAYESPVYGFRLMSRTADFGNAIISNHALQDRETVFTNLTYKTDFDISVDDYNVRNFQHVSVAYENGKKLHVINYHGYHVPSHKNGNDYTKKACKQIAEYAKRLDGPVIITGDFNLLPDSESIEILNNDFRNLTKEYGLKTTRTNLTHKSEPCDFIFVNENIKVNDFYASEVVASDHRGLVLDFDIR